MGDRGSGDIEVHGGVASPGVNQQVRFGGACFIEINDQARSEVVEKFVQLCVGLHLLERGLRPRYKSKPPTHLLLDADNCRRDILVRSVKPLRQSLKFGAVAALQDAEHASVSRMITAVSNSYEV